MSGWPELDELVWLFEADPTFEFDDWDYPTCATAFTTRRDAWTIDCVIEVFTGSLTIVLSQAGHEVVRLDLWGVVAGVVVDRTHGHEALVAIMSAESRMSELRLELRPMPSVSWTPWPIGSTR